jgi:hypothetical protein
MKIRTIKPAFWSSAKIASVSREARLVFIGLWNVADDEGRLLGGTKGLAGLLFEHDEDVGAREIASWLDQLEGCGLIHRYSVAGVGYIDIPGFFEHQKIDRRYPSRLPPPPAQSGLSSPTVKTAGPTDNTAGPVVKTALEVEVEVEEGSGKGKVELRPALPPTVAVEVIPAGPAERAEARRSDAVVRSSMREHRGGFAAAGAIMGRPQSVDALLALLVRELADGRIVTAPEDGRPLREVWTERFKPLDGKGEPRRKSIAEFAEVMWPYEVNRAWTLDGANYLSWWTSKMSDEAEKSRRAWEAQGGAGAADPERVTAKRRWLEIKALRDVPPFETWLAERWQRGLDHRDVDAEDAPPPQGPSGGTRPSGQTRALLSPTVDPFAAAGVDPDARAPNLTEMMEASRRRRQTEEQT